MPFTKGHKLSKGGRRNPPGGRPSRIQKEIREAVQEIVRKYIEDHIKPILRAYGRLASGKNADPATVRHFIDRLIPPAKTMTSVELTGSLPDQIYQMIQAAKQK